MKVILVHSSGFVTSYFGPFDGKPEARKWAEESELTNYSLVIVLSPWGNDPGKGKI